MSLPVSRRMDVAIFETSPSKSSSRWLTLKPMPATTYWSSPVSPSTLSSVKMPQSFLPFRMRSFVHLICECVPATRSTARLIATAMRPVSGISCDGASFGRSKIDR